MDTELFGIVFAILVACALLRACGEVMEAYLVGRRSCQNVDWYAAWLIQIGELERAELVIPAGADLNLDAIAEGRTVFYIPETKESK